MCKTTVRLLTFYATIFIGIAATGAWHRTVDKPVRQFPPIAVNVPFEPAPDKVIPANTADKSYNLAPCVNPNPLRQYKSKRKNNTIGIGMVNGWLTCGVLPEYPQTARERSISGKVILTVLIDETGEIAEVSVVSGNPLLHEAALKAIHQSRACPILLGGEAMKGRGILLYQFDSESGVSLPRNTPTYGDAAIRRHVAR